MHISENVEIQKALRQMDDEKIKVSYENFLSASKGRVWKVRLGVNWLFVCLVIVIGVVWGWITALWVFLVVALVASMFVILAAKLILPAFEGEIARRESQKRMEKFYE